MTPPGIEPATFQFVAQHLNHCATTDTYIHTYTHTHTHTQIYIHTHIPWTYTCITKQRNVYQVINTQIHKFTYQNTTAILHKEYYKPYLHTNNPSTWSKQCECCRFLMVALHYASPFLGGKIVKVLMSSQNARLWKQDRLGFSLLIWCLFFVLILCIDGLLDGWKWIH